MNIFNVIEKFFRKGHALATFLPTFLTLISSIGTASHTRNATDIEAAAASLVTTIDSLSGMHVPLEDITAFEDAIDKIIADLR